jgi:hypothetical protein
MFGLSMQTNEVNSTKDAMKGMGCQPSPKIRKPLQCSSFSFTPQDLSLKRHHLANSLDSSLLPAIVLVDLVLRWQDRTLLAHLFTQSRALTECESRTATGEFPPLVHSSSVIQAGTPVVGTRVKCRHKVLAADFAAEKFSMKLRIVTAASSTPMAMLRS